MADKVRELVAWQLVLMDKQHPEDLGLSLETLPVAPLFISDNLGEEREESFPFHFLITDCATRLACVLLSLDRHVALNSIILK